MLSIDVRAIRYSMTQPWIPASCLCRILWRTDNLGMSKTVCFAILRFPPKVPFCASMDGISDPRPPKMFVAGAKGPHGPCRSGTRALKDSLDIPSSSSRLSASLRNAPGKPSLLQIWKASILFFASRSATSSRLSSASCSALPSQSRAGSTQARCPACPYHSRSAPRAQSSPRAHRPVSH